MDEPKSNKQPEASFAASDGCAAPVVDQDGTCGHGCPHWQSTSDENMMSAKCNLLGKELTYYDGWQSECEAQHNDQAHAPRK